MKATGGGAFDRTDRHCYFIAGDGWMEQGASRHTHVLLAMSTLMSADKLAMLDRMLDAGVKVFLDSGVFSLAWAYARQHGVDIMDAFKMPPEQMPGFPELWAQYVKVIKAREDRLWGYVEIDLGGTDGKRRLRTHLEAEGLRPIPVYHPLGDGWDYFDEVASQYDRLCFGNLADGDRTRRKRIAHTAWERHRAYPDLWVHLLGFTPNDWLTGLPCDSADSSTWLGGVRWGGEGGTGHLRRVGALPHNYRYADAASQAEKAVLLAAVNSHLQHRTWRRIRRDLDDALGGVAYPASVGRERVK